MSKIIAIAAQRPQLPALEVMRSIIVCVCALALIQAGQNLPF
jgi:hypothetical protein